MRFCSASSDVFMIWIIASKPSVSSCHWFSIKLNEYNCKDLRNICKREEIRTRGKKVELVERILKKTFIISTIFLKVYLVGICMQVLFCS